MLEHGRVIKHSKYMISLRSRAMTSDMLVKEAPGTSQEKHYTFQGRNTNMPNIPYIEGSQMSATHDHWMHLINYI